MGWKLILILALVIPYVSVDEVSSDLGYFSWLFCVHSASWLCKVTGYLSNAYVL